MKKFQTKIILMALCLVLALGGGASAQPDAAYNNNREIADPIEPVNRFVFGFNDILDRLIVEPLAKGYNAILPRPVRDGIQNFMRNLKSPLIVANNLLQGEFGDAGIAAARFVINTTVGVGGVIDAAKSHGLLYDNEDFGQTLAKWGMGDGFYLVLPVFGPSSLRDAAGLAVDSYGDPVRLYADNTDRMWLYYTREAVEGIDTRSRYIAAIDDMRNNTLDYYASARSAYTQKRLTLIKDEKPGTVAIPSYDSP